MAGSFVIERSKSGKFKFNLRAGNNRVILTSELYESKAAAENGIESVRKNSSDDGRFERKSAKDGSRYFVLKAKNGETVGKSEMYTSASAMEKGVTSVRTSAGAAKVIDRTTD
ncbi:MAG: YegP family protein [Thermoanaerobaculia bacterium]